MSNVIEPQTTNLAASGKNLKVQSTLEFDMGEPAVDRKPLITLVRENIAFDQMIPFQVNIQAAQKGYNLWEAPSEDLRARAVVILCHYGAGGIIINGAGDPLPFPIGAGGWVLYVNPLGTSLEVDVGGTPTDTGPGIQKITVDTENESRFQGYVFV